MPRSRHNRSLSYRAQQTGLLIASANIPLTFQRTLMPRNTSDQALITGLSFAANNAIASLVQESLQSAALLLAGTEGHRGAATKRWSRAAIAVDAAAILAGIGIQNLFPPRKNEKLHARRAPHRRLLALAHRHGRRHHRRFARSAPDVG